MIQDHALFPLVYLLIQWGFFEFTKLFYTFAPIVVGPWLLAFFVVEFFPSVAGIYIWYKDEPDRNAQLVVNGSSFIAIALFFAVYEMFFIFESQDVLFYFVLVYSIFIISQSSILLLRGITSLIKNKSSDLDANTH